MKTGMLFVRKCRFGTKNQLESRAEFEDNCNRSRMSVRDWLIAYLGAMQSCVALAST